MGAAGDRGDEEDAVAFFQRARLAAEEADVFFVEVDVEELADLAGLVADVLGEVREASGQLGEGCRYGGAGTVDFWGAVGEAAECGGNFDCYAHHFSLRTTSLLSFVGPRLATALVRFVLISNAYQVLFGACDCAGGCQLAVE